jgi:fimbrial chaperone protein
MLRRRQVVAGFAAATGMLAARPAAAASLEFQPVVTEATPGPFTSTLEVFNRGGGEAVLQLRAFTWTQAPGAADTLTQTGAIVLSPPMFTLPEGERQTVRVVMRTQQAAVEQAFRLLIDEIPRGEFGQVRMALRISLPVFVAGGAGAADLQWHAAPDSSGGVLVSVRNIGHRRARIANLSVAGAGRAAVAGQLLDQNPYVLAGGERRWLVPTRLRPGEHIQVTAEHESGPIAVPLAIGA